MKTSFLTKESALAERKWVAVDATDKVVGRLATEIAGILRGKNKPSFSPHSDLGDFVVVINAEKVKFTGKKESDKTYYRHTGYVGGIKVETAAELRSKKPEEIIKRAVKGMLPRNDLGRNQLKKLKVYVGTEHPHNAQQPASLG